MADGCRFFFNNRWRHHDKTAIVTEDYLCVSQLLDFIRHLTILYNDNTRAVIGRCPWSIRGQIHGWRREKLFLTVLLNMVRGFENVCEIISDKSKWKLKKNLAPELFTKKKNGKTETERALDNLRMPKLQETTVAIVCHRYETRCSAKIF